MLKTLYTLTLNMENQVGIDQETSSMLASFHGAGRFYVAGKSTQGKSYQWSYSAINLCYSNAPRDNIVSMGTIATQM